MNAHCEHVIDATLREALDHGLIMNEAHARHVLAAYERHHNEHRPHRARNQLPPPAPTSNPRPYTSPKTADSCAPASSAASSTSTATQFDLQRRASEPLP
ncbi:transposase [Streptomyces brasiliensis]|uniref:Integrase catalytic domain-containing protein n=1 Tax=Streptomyces brasiliensis TaxID=1954 RepID=A0A917P3J2_9ACTN|nr:transposase [Streptomyces brasiliensis]GGJ60024.1 hypothetical protein GCM10010121_083320 [Streptomyces brasiliensis]